MFSLGRACSRNMRVSRRHGHNRYLHKMFHGVFHGLFHKVFHNLCRKPQYLLCSLHNTPRSSYTDISRPTYVSCPADVSHAADVSGAIRLFPIPGATVGSTAPRSSVLRSTSGLRATTLFRCAATIRANGSGNASHNAQRNACHDARSNARGHADRSSPCMAHVASQGGQSCNGTDSRL